MIILRPHHLNCIYFFKGLGYTLEFVQNMTQIIAQMKAYPDEPVKFARGFDDLCTACPYKKDRCENPNSGAEVDLLDRRTVEEYGLDLSREYSYREISQVFYQNFDFDRFDRICVGCEWLQSGDCGRGKDRP